LIGIILHEKRIAGKTALKKEPYKINQKRKIIDELQNEIEMLQLELLGTSEKKKKELIVQKIERSQMKKMAFIADMMDSYVCMIMANIYRIVEVSGKSGWNHVCLGSDFDGTINKMDFFGTSEDLPSLAGLMLNFMRNPASLDNFDKKWTKAYLKKLHFGMSPEELIEKFTNGNADAFLKKYFTDEYRVFAKNPA